MGRVFKAIASGFLPSTTSTTGRNLDTVSCDPRENPVSDRTVAEDRPFLLVEVIIEYTILYKSQNNKRDSYHSIRKCTLK